MSDIWSRKSSQPLIRQGRSNSANDGLRLDGLVSHLSTLRQHRARLDTQITRLRCPHSVPLSLTCQQVLAVMDEQPPAEQQQVPTAPFPAPPPFWKQFTTSNVNHLKAIQLEQKSTFDPADANLNLPAELAYLVPPPPPPSDTEQYYTFSTAHALSPVPQQIQDSVLLFNPTSPNTKADLKKLLHALTQSLLLNFLELTTILGTNPAHYREKLEDLERLFINVHHAINLYRPRQAREEVVRMLERQIDGAEDEIKRCEDMGRRVKEFLRGVQEATVVKGMTIGDINGEADGGKSTVDAQEERTRRMWQAIRDLDDE